MRYLLRVGPYLRWPLAVGTLALVAMAAGLVPSVLASLDRGEPRSLWCGVAFAATAVALTYWQRRNLENQLYDATWSLTVAHIGGTVVTTGLMVLPVVAVFLLLNQMFEPGGIFEENATIRSIGESLAKLIFVVTYLPAMYLSGTITGDILTGKWLAFRSLNSPPPPRYYSKSSSEQESEFLRPVFLTMIPCLIVAACGIVVYQYMHSSSPAAVRCGSAWAAREVLADARAALEKESPTAVPEPEPWKRTRIWGHEPLYRFPRRAVPAESVPATLKQ